MHMETTSIINIGLGLILAPLLPGIINKTKASFADEQAHRCCRLILILLSN